MVAPSPNDRSVDHHQEYEGPVQALLRLTETAGLLRSTDGSFHARVAVGSRPEVYALRSAQFRDWLIDGYVRFRACREAPLIGRCFAETFEEQPVDPSWPADPGSSPAPPPTP